MELIKKIKTAAQWNDNASLVRLFDDYDALIYKEHIKPLREKLYSYVDMANNLNELLSIYRNWFVQMSVFIGGVRIAQGWKSKPYKEFVAKRLKRFDVETFDGYIEKRILENDSRLNNSD